MRLNGHEFEQTLGDGEGPKGLACCPPWGHKEPDMTWVTADHLDICYSGPEALGVLGTRTERAGALGNGWGSSTHPPGGGDGDGRGRGPEPGECLGGGGGRKYHRRPTNPEGKSHLRPEFVILPFVP